MRIEFIGRNYTPSERLKSVVEKKFDKLDRYFDTYGKPESKLSSFIEKDNAVAKFVCSQEKNKERYTLEATVHFGDRIIRAEETASSIFDTIDVVIDRLERQVSKLRTKFEKDIKSPVDLTLEYLNKENNLDEFKMKAVKSKKFQLTPLSTEGAIDELILLDHDFFIYLNAETGKVNVVYKRHKGDVGVIECDY
ncbi:MAG: ribosome-associated translation inhibitor RaiA [Clostridia bacterium]